MSHSNNRDLKELIRVAYQQKIDLCKVNWIDILPFFQKIDSEKQLQRILWLAFRDFTIQVKDDILLQILASQKNNGDPLPMRFEIIEKLSNQLQLVEPLSKQTQWLEQQYYLNVLLKTYNVNPANLNANRLIFIKNILKNEVIHEFIERLTTMIQFSPCIGEKYPNAKIQLNNLSEFYQYYKQQKILSRQNVNIDYDITDDNSNNEDNYYDDPILNEEQQKIFIPCHELFLKDCCQFQLKFQQGLQPLPVYGSEKQLVFVENTQQIKNCHKLQKIEPLNLNLTEHKSCHDQTTQTQQVSKHLKKKLNKKKREKELLNMNQPVAPIELQKQISEKDQSNKNKCHDDIKEFEERLEADCVQSKVIEKLKPRISAEWIKKFQIMFIKKIKWIRSK